MTFQLLACQVKPILYHSSNIKHITNEVIADDGNCFPNLGDYEVSLTVSNQFGGVSDAFTFSFTKAYSTLAVVINAPPSMTVDRVTLFDANFAKCNEVLVRKKVSINKSRFLSESQRLILQAEARRDSQNVDYNNVEYTWSVSSYFALQLFVSHQLTQSRPQADDSWKFLPLTCKPAPHMSSLSRWRYQAIHQM